MTPVLPERARSECARSTAAVAVTLTPLPMEWKIKNKEAMRAVKGSLGHFPKRGQGSDGQMRWSPVLVQRAAADSPRWTRAVETI